MFQRHGRHMLADVTDRRVCGTAPWGVRGNAAQPWRLVDVVAGPTDTGFRVLRGPISSKRDLAAITEALKGRRLVGMTSRGPFPGRSPGHDALLSTDGRPEGFVDLAGPLVERAEAWLHCFRRPEQFLPPGRPATLISESDFKDPDHVWAAGCPDGQPVPQWDVVYVGGSGRLHEIIKNWALARRALGVLGTALSLRALVVGRYGTWDLDMGDGSLDVFGELPWPDLMECVARSRMVLFPNSADASPRLLAEALCLDVPVLVNRKILGGWKYVAPATGEFFATDAELLAGARALLTAPRGPRDWFSARFGPQRSGERLAAFLAGLDR